MDDIRRVNLLGKRFYEVKNIGIFPSVTTVLSTTADKSGLEKWKKRVGEDEAKRIANEATRRGSVMHKHLEIYLGEDLTQNRETILEISKEKAKTDSEINSFDNRAKKVGNDLFMKFYNDDDFFPSVQETIFQEKFLWFNIAHLGYAGTLDNFSLLKCGSKKIIDFKTARKPKREEWIVDYKLQTSAYAFAVWQRFGIKPDGAEIWIANEIDDVPQKFILNHEQLKYYFQQFIERLKAFEEIKKRAQIAGINI